MLPEEVTNLIGKAGDVSIFEVEKGAIRRFADAVDDPNPLYYDEEYAKESRYGSIIAPPGFVSLPWFTARLPQRARGGAPASDPRMELREALLKAGYTNPAGIDAGIEYDFFRPVRAGDTLAATSMIKEVNEREGKSGKMVFIVIETTYVNQNGDLVAKARSIGMQR